jgi:UDP-3-O-[3-hydroxymyristoyl] N-acetylglucosamine deacetylase
MGFINGGRKSANKSDGKVFVKQKTLKSSINCAGIALHSGAKAVMTLRAAEPDTGIVFVRTDIAGGGAVIPATWDRVVDTRMCTTLANEDGITVGTVEHLMAAFSGCGIDNALVEINGPEIPVMDGSAAPFVFLIECAGIVEQDAPRRYLQIRKPVAVEDADSSAYLKPGAGFALGFEIDFSGTAVSRQALHVELGRGIFQTELSRARTFGFLNDVERLWAAGLAKGGSLDNAVVVSGERILNQEGLRYEDEFVRHKVLDAVGDLYLAGAPIIGAFHGICSGHGTNNRLLRNLFADAEAWTFVNLTQEEADAGMPGGAWSQEPSERLAASA